MICEIRPGRTLLDFGRISAISQPRFWRHRIA